MKHAIMTTGIVLALVAGAAEKFSYRGQLAKPDGSAFNTSHTITMTFRIYDTPTGGDPLWGRTMPVRMEADGSFYVELSDDRGSVPADVPRSSLHRALFYHSAFWIGLTPGTYTELLPRQKLVDVPRALSAKAARRAERLKAARVSAVALEIASAAEVADLTVKAACEVDGGTSLVLPGDHAFSAAGDIKLTGGLSGINASPLPASPPARAPTDMFVIRRAASGTPGGYSSLVIPAGATLHDCGGSETLAITFGKGL